MRAEPERFTRVFCNGRWRIGDDGLQLLILVWICVMVCLIFWIQDLQVISLLLRPALMMSRINASKYIRCDQAVHVTDRLQFFDAVVTPVTPFGAGHRTLQKRDLQTMGYARLKLFRNRFVLLLLLIGPVLGMKFSILGTKKLKQ